MKETSHYRAEHRIITCLLCPHTCSIKEGGRGRCGARENRGGLLYERTYPYVPALSLDPIEKKPLYHFFPGSSILSLGMEGCNLSCSFCQNHELSQGRRGGGRRITPLDLVELALGQSSIGLAFTYSEPLIFFEYLKEAAPLAKERGLKVVLVSNGFYQQEPLIELLPYIDAVNLDIKGFAPYFYEDYCKGSLEPVLKTAELLVHKGIHLEVTNLIIPTLNDSKEDLLALFYFLKNLNPEIPLHLSRYFPCYQMGIPMTSEKTLKRAYEQAKEALPFVYLGNLPHDQYQKTNCPVCSKTLVERSPYLKIEAIEGQCPQCGYSLPIQGLTSSESQRYRG